MPKPITPLQEVDSCDHLTSRCSRCVANREAAELLQPLGDYGGHGYAVSVVPSILYRGRPTMLVSRAGFGKSTLVRQWVASASRGVDWLTGQSTGREPERVLWVGEEGVTTLTYALVDFEADEARIRHVDIDLLESPALLRSLERVWCPSLTVLDPMGDLLALEGVNERDYFAMRAALKAWMPGPGDPARCFIHHAHRPREQGRGDALGSYYGSTGIETVFDLMYELRPVPKGGDTRRDLACVKSRITGVERGSVVRLDYLPVTDEEPPDRAYRLVTEPEPDAGDDLAALVQAYRRAHPVAGITACAVALGIRRGGDSRRYRALRDLW